MQHIRVSEILAQFRDFSKINSKVLHEKCQIGTEVHTNIHAYKTDGFPMFDLYPIRDFKGEILLEEYQETYIDDFGNTHIHHKTRQKWERRGKDYFKSYLQWDKKNNPNFGIMEQRFYDDNLMLTGQIDALMTTDSLPVLVDFKCSYKKDVEIWSMQAHYYKHLLEHNGVKIADHFLWLRLEKDGKKPEVVKIEFDENIMSRCIDEAVLFWERKMESKCVV